MKSLKSEVCSLKMAKLLSKYRIRAKSRYIWFRCKRGGFELGYNNEVNKMISVECYPAFTAMELIKLLSKKTYNGESFGLAIQVCNRNEWSVFYYSHYSKKHNDNFPTVVGKTIPEALCKMLLQMKGYVAKSKSKGFAVA